MNDSLHILGIAGSLRSGSFNRALLGACEGLLPEGAGLVVHEIADVPLYNQDLDGPQGDGPDRTPAPVVALREAIRGADAVLLASPEYNFGIPGVLKNAIDWASRPAFRSGFRGKPVGIMSASPSGMGGARAQLSLQNVLLGMLAEPFPHPGLAIARAMDLFEDGELTDEKTRDFLRDYLDQFVDWVRARASS